MNARELLPVEKYLIGCILPPHLSPFVDYTKSEAYNPEDEEALQEAAELLAARGMIFIFIYYYLSSIN